MLEDFSKDIIKSIKNNDKIVVFDFDKTLTNIDTTLLLTRFILKNTGVLYKYPFVLSIFIAFRLRLVSEQFFKEKLCLIIVKGKSINNIKKIVNRFYDSYAKILFNSKMTNLLLGYSKEGFKVYVVSSNLNFLIEPILGLYPIDGILSTIAESDNFLYTGNIKGSVCNGNQKFLRASDILTKPTEILSIGYGDSVGDFPLLKACDTAYIVKNRNLSQLNKFKTLINLLWGKIDIVESKIEIEKFSQNFTLSIGTFERNIWNILFKIESKIIGKDFNNNFMESIMIPFFKAFLIQK